MKSKRMLFAFSLIILFFVNIISAQDFSGIILYIDGHSELIDESQINDITKEAVVQLKETSPFDSSSYKIQNYEWYIPYVPQEIYLWNMLKEVNERNKNKLFYDEAKNILSNKLKLEAPDMSWKEFENLLKTKGHKEMATINNDLINTLETVQLINKLYKDTKPLTEMDRHVFSKENENLLEVLRIEDSSDIIELFQQQEALQEFFKKNSNKVNVSYCLQNIPSVSEKLKNRNKYRTDYLYKRLKVFHEEKKLSLTVIGIGEKIIKRRPKSSYVYREACEILKEVFEDNPKLLADYDGDKYIEFLNNEIKECVRRNKLSQKIEEIEVLRFRKIVRNLLAKDYKENLLSNFTKLANNVIKKNEEKTYASKIAKTVENKKTRSYSNRKKARSARQRTQIDEYERPQRTNTRSRSVNTRTRTRGNCPYCNGTGNKDPRLYTPEERGAMSAVGAQMGGFRSFSVPCPYCNGTGSR